MQNTTETDNNQNNGNNITLDLRVSCNTFWKYEMKLTVNRDDFVEPNANNANDINCGGGGAGTDPAGGGQSSGGQVAGVGTGT